MKKTLREMYANLLANALDSDTANKTHPSFVDIIKQLSPMEAKLLLFLSKKNTYPYVCTYYKELTMGGEWDPWGGEAIRSNQVRKIFMDLCKEFDDDLDIGSAFDNFCRLQILDVESSTTQSLNNSWSPQDSDELSKRLEIEIKHNEELVFTDFGMRFIEVCVTDKA